MNKEKISKLVCILLIIVFIAAGLSRCVGGNSMTLAEYAAQKEQAQ